MTSAILLTATQTTELKELRNTCETKAKYAGCMKAAAVFLLLSALIVIVCGSLCVMLPGVNVINHVILPAIIPGILGVLLSIPLIIGAVRYHLDMESSRKKMIDKMIEHLNDYKVPEMTRKKRVEFIEKNFLKPNWTPQYQTQILNDIREKIGTEKKERNVRQEKIARALDKASENINKSK